MYALVVTWKQEPRRPDARPVEELEHRLLPLVRFQPGFVSGTFSWDPASARTVSHAVFTTEAHARGFGDYLLTADARRTVGAELESIVVAAVVADVEGTR